MKRTIIWFLVSILCGYLYAQDSIVVYQGNNTHMFLLSDIDSITHSGSNTLNLYHNLRRTGYSVTTVDSIAIKEGEQKEIEDITITNVIDWNAIHVAKDGYKLLSFQQEIAVSENSPNVITPTVRCNTPQVMLLLNANDEIIMMSRGVYNNGVVNKIDAHNTAIAMVTLHPLFGSVKSEAYNDLVFAITSSSYYPQFEIEVQKSVGNGANLYDTNNTSLFSSFSTLMEDLTTEDTDNADSELSIEVSTRSIIANGKTNIAGIDVGPFLVSATGSRLSIQTYPLSPFYEGTVTSNDGSWPLDIPSWGSIGLTNIFRPVQNSDPIVFDFAARLLPEGEYLFHFDRTTPRANFDFGCSVVADVIDIVGLPLSTLEVKDLSTVCWQYITVEMADVASVVTSRTDVDGGKVCELLIGGILNFFSSDELYNWAVKHGLKEKLLKESTKALLKKMSGVFAAYQAARGTFNAVTRVVMRLDSAPIVDFCLCYYEKHLETCTEVSLEKISGDEQSGYANQRLLEPLVVQVFTYADDGTEVKSSSFHRVEFTIESGGGRLSKETVNVDDKGMASTYWYLGEETDNNQKVRACVVDIVTGKEISQPVFFFASKQESTDITFRLDWDKTLTATDIDLHVLCPQGHHIYYQDMSCSCGGQLDRDDRQGPGPEHIRFNNAEPGEYIVYVHHYESESKATIGWTLTTTTKERTYRNVGSVPYHAYGQKYKLTISPNTSNSRRRSPKVEFERIEGEFGPMPDLPKK